MRIVNKVEIAAIQNHLRNLNTSIHLDQADLPSHKDGHWHGYKVTLNSDDLDRVILWWENQNHTKNKTCKVADLLPSAKNLERVQSFIVGSDAKGLSPLGLRSADGMEPCVVASSIDDDFLYVIDGNHRLIAHWLQGRSLDDVTIYVAVHDNLKSWVYIPSYWKKQWQPLD